MPFRALIGRLVADWRLRSFAPPFGRAVGAVWHFLFVCLDCNYSITLIWADVKNFLAEILNEKYAVCRGDFVDFSQRTFDLLKKQGKKQKELADFIGVSERTVSNWKERGTDPPAKYSCQIADFFGVTVEWLLTGEESNGINNFSGSINEATLTFGDSRGSNVVYGNGNKKHSLSPESAELLRIFDSINDVWKRFEVLQMAKDIMENSKMPQSV